MGNKFSNKYIWVLMLVLGVFVMAVTALIGGNSSIRNAQQTAQRTLQYLQNQCISYRDIVAADRLKSLVRLTEQAQEVAEREGMVGQNRSNEELARYAQRQRVTCVLVLDKDLEIEFSSGADMDWSDYYTNEAIRSVMDYPEKIFARRLTRDGAVYDIAAVARVENPGVVFCVRLQSNTIIASYRASIESLLAGYETLLNERIYTYITDGEKIIGSSDNDQWNLPVDSVPLITALEQADSGSRLAKLDCGGTFFGMRGMYQKYSLYVFLPADFVFAQTKNMLISAFGVYALAAVLATLLVLHTTQDRKRRELAYQKQLEKEVACHSGGPGQDALPSQHEPRHTHTHQHHHGYAGDHRAEPGGCDAGAVLPGEGADRGTLSAGVGKRRADAESPEAGGAGKDTLLFDKRAARDAGYFARPGGERRRYADGDGPDAGA